MNNLNQKQFKLLLALVTVGIVSRFLPHPPNITAVAAVSLFAGAILNSRLFAVLMPMVLMYLSDFAINNTVGRVYFTEHEGLVLWSSYMTWVYIGFGLTALIGYSLLKNRTTAKLAGGAILATLVFWLCSNFGSFIDPINVYPFSINGLMACYIAALPFLLNSLIGNLFFTFVIFGIYDYVNARYFQAQPVRA